MTRWSTNVPVSPLHPRPSRCHGHRLPRRLSRPPLTGHHLLRHDHRQSAELLDVAALAIALDGLVEMRQATRVIHSPADPLRLEALDRILGHDVHLMSDSTFPGTDLRHPPLTKLKNSLVDIWSSESMCTGNCSNVVSTTDRNWMDRLDPVVPKQCQRFPVHFACLLPGGTAIIQSLCAGGAKVDAYNNNFQTALHYTLLVSSSPDVEQNVRTLLMAGANPNCVDSHGEAPLIYLRLLLKREQHATVVALARLLLQYGAEPDAGDTQSRTLLTYSVSYLDATAELTKLLLNYGATPWGPPEMKDSEQRSVFGWFLKAVIRRRRLDHYCAQTLRLLAQAMSVEPRRMHSHVMTTMFSHVRCFSVLGPVFLQLKLAVRGYWSDPKDLRNLCWMALRRCVGPRRMAHAVPKMGLPVPLQRYLLMD